MQLEHEGFVYLNSYEVRPRILRSHFLLKPHEVDFLSYKKENIFDLCSVYKSLGYLYQG